MNNLIVKHHRPWKLPLLVLAVLLVSGLLGWGLYEYGRFKAGFDIEAAEKSVADLKQANNELDKVNSRLREERAILERSSQVERQAYKELEGTVSGLHREIAELKSDLDFYRGIVSPREASQGLKVERLDLTANTVAHSYHYKLVLTQVLKNSNLITGDITMELEGSQDGGLKTLELEDISADKKKSLAFRFKYFQNFEGDFLLPEGFVPARLVIKVNPKGQRQPNIEKTIEWPAEEA